MKYNILVSCNTNKVFPSVGSVVDEVNHHMEGFGFSEKLVLRSERVPMAVMTSDRELLPEECVKIAVMYAENFEKAFPGSNPEIEIVLQ